MLEFFIGRDPICDVVIDDPTVSRRHAKLIVTNDNVHVISDFNSKHGTFIRENGSWKRVSSAEVAAENEIRLGQRVLTISGLIKAANNSRAAIRDTPMERNPETGEIIPRR